MGKTPGRGWDGPITRSLPPVLSGGWDAPGTERLRSAHRWSPRGDRAVLACGCRMWALNAGHGVEAETTGSHPAAEGLRIL